MHLILMTIQNPAIPEFEIHIWSDTVVLPRRGITPRSLFGGGDYGRLKLSKGEGMIRPISWTANLAEQTFDSKVLLRIATLRLAPHPPIMVIPRAHGHAMVSKSGMIIRISKLSMQWKV